MVKERGQDQDILPKAREPIEQTFTEYPLCISGTVPGNRVMSSHEQQLKDWKMLNLQQMDKSNIFKF